MTDLAVYDMDKTVTRRPTYTHFLLHCALRAKPWRLLTLPLVAASLIGYALKLVDRARLKEINHRLLLGGMTDKARLEPLVESFAEATLRSNLYEDARAAIAADRAEGRMIVMATASYRFYAAAIGRRLGFDHVIGTDAVTGAEGAICSRIAGENCYGPAKMRMIAHWLGEDGVTPGHVRFYSDHHSDAPVFEWADEAVAVNPSPALRALAQERGWKIVHWR